MVSNDVQHILPGGEKFSKEGEAPSTPVVTGLFLSIVCCAYVAVGNFS